MVTLLIVYMLRYGKDSVPNKPSKKRRGKSETVNPKKHASVQRPKTARIEHLNYKVSQPLTTC